MKLPFIVIFCGNEKYIFYYSPGKEDELVCQMIDYAMDERHALGWADVRSVMRHFNLLKMETADGRQQAGNDARGADAAPGTQTI